MSTEITTLAASAVPYVVAAVHSYGASVLDKLQEAAADSTVGIGGRILRRILVHDSPAIESAVTDLAEDADDEDRRAALRLQIRKALAADPELAAAVAEEIGTGAPSIVASGERSVAAHHVSGIVVTGDGAHIAR